MNEYNRLLEQIPIEYDLFGLITFTNVFFGSMIFIIILLKNESKHQAIYFLGYGVLALTLTQVDFFLCYTGLMKYVPFLYNFSEVFVLIFPVCLYFFFIHLLKQTKIQWQKNWWHLVVPILYLILQTGDHLQSEAYKLNSYMFGFHPHLKPIPQEIAYQWWYELPSFIIGDFRYLLVGIFLFYILLSIRLVRTYNAKITKQFSTKKTQTPTLSQKKYRYTTYMIITLMATTVVCIIVYNRFSTSLGDKYIALFPTATIFFLAYVMMSSSHFFDQSWLLEKYHTSGLNIPTSDILQKIIAFVEEEQYYLKKESSLKDLAERLSLSPNYLSQIINDQTHKNFSDFINHYRIEEVKKRLIDDAYSHLNMAGIGESVGFKSKSSFYSVFKKHTQLTPAAYAKAMKG